MLTGGKMSAIWREADVFSRDPFEPGDSIFLITIIRNNRGNLVVYQSTETMLNCTCVKHLHTDILSKLIVAGVPNEEMNKQNLADFLQNDNPTSRK